MTGCGTQEGATYDEYEKEYCDEQFDLSDDKKKVEEKKFEDLLGAIAESEEGTVTTKEQIDALKGGIHAPLSTSTCDIKTGLLIKTASGLLIKTASTCDIVDF